MHPELSKTRICAQADHMPQHTRSVHHEQYSLLTSTNMNSVLVAQELNGSDI